MTSRRILAALALLCVLTPRQSKASDFVSVMDYAAQYGCVPGDYTTACQDAFDAAIVAVQTFSQSGDDTLSYSGTVHVPAAAGCFRITAPITMLKGVSLLGEGGLGSCILADDTDALRYTYASGYGQPQVSNILLYGCRWDTGTSACLPPTAARTGIIRPQTVANADADSQYGLAVQNTLIWGFDTAIDLTTVRNFWLTNSYFQNVNICVTFAGLGWSARIEGLQCTHDAGDGLGAVGDGIVAIPYTYDAGSTTGSKGPESVKIDKSHIHDFRTGVWSKAGAFTTITKSDIQATVNGIRFSDVFGGYTIRDNYIGMNDAAIAHGIWGEGIAASYQDSHQTVIEGNILVATGATTATCIQINESGTTNQDNVNIRSNQCSGFKAYDLDAFNPGAMTVSDNFFKSTPVTGSIRIGTRRTGVIKVEKNETASTVTATTASDVTNGYVRFCNNVRGGSTLDGCDMYTPTIHGAMTAGAINAGAISGTTFNNILLPIPASTAVLTLGSGKTVTVSNTLTFNGTDGSSMAFGGGGTVLYNGGALGTPSSGTLTNATGLPISTGLTGAGTGILGALAVNTGSAGAPVLLNGAGGTPSSLTLTNGNGLPISTGLNGAGTGVLAALAINVGSAGAFVTNGGALGSPSSAGTLPAHTLGGTISGGGNQINNVVIGAGTPLAGSFTTLQVNTSGNFGNSAAPDATLTVNNNNGATVAPDFPAGLHLIASDSADGGILADVFGHEASFVGRISGGTRASKTAVGAGVGYTGFYGAAYNGSAYVYNAALEYFTFNAQSGTDSSSRARLRLVASGSTALTDVMSWGPGVNIGSTQATLSASELGMNKITVSGAAPGAGTGKLAIVAGTNAGTCKLIMYAGTSTTATTIIDNVGAGC